MELAVATNTPVSAWWDQTDAVIATALDVLDEQGREVSALMKRRR